MMGAAAGELGGLESLIALKEGDFELALLLFIAGAEFGHAAAILGVADLFLGGDVAALKIKGGGEIAASLVGESVFLPDIGKDLDALERGGDEVGAV